MGISVSFGHTPLPAAFCRVEMAEERCLSAVIGGKVSFVNHSLPSTMRYPVACCWEFLLNGFFASFAYFVVKKSALLSVNFL